MDKERFLKELTVRKIHVLPRLLSTLPPAIAAEFDSQWEPATRLAALLGNLAVPALRFLSASATGALVIGPDELRYARGPYALLRSPLQNVAFVSAASLLGDGILPLHVVACLYDHLLGSAGAADGPCLSDGAGVTRQWAEVGAQIPRLFALDHNPDPFCRNSPADYFARSVALYALHQRELSVADPKMYRLLRRSFFSERFWRHNDENQ